MKTGIAVCFVPNTRGKKTKGESVSLLGEVRYLVNGKEHRFRFSTGIKVKDTAFHDGVINHKRDVDAEAKNAILQTLKTSTESIYLNSIKSGKIKSPEDYKAAILASGKEVKQEKTTIEYLDEFIAHLKAHDKSKHTTKGMERLKVILQGLKAKGVSIAFEDIDSNFETHFLNALKKEKYAPNTRGSYVKRLKVFLNHCTKNNVNRNNIYKHFRIIDEPQDEIVALSEIEVETIAKLDLPKHKHVTEGGTRLTRDWFIIGTQTGLRYSDLSKVITAKRVPVPNGYFDLHIFKTNKTKAPTVIPATRLLNDILTGYNFEIPPPPSNQNYNEALKRIAIKAEINKNLTSHTARRTFCTIMYRKGIPVSQIMKISGHKTEKEFYKYIGVSLSENAQLVRDQLPEMQKMTA